MTYPKRAVFSFLVAFQAALLVIGHGPARADTYVIGIENIEYMPHYSSVGEEVYGYARELFDAYGDDAGIQFRYQPYPVIRLAHNLAGGIVDFKYPANPNWKQHREITVYYSDPVAQYRDGLSVRPESLGKPVKSIAIVRGFTPQAYLTAIENDQIRISEHNTLRDVVIHVLRGRSDAAYGDQHVIQYFLKNFLHKPRSLAFDPGAPFTEGNYRLATIRHREIIEDLNHWLRDNRKLVTRLKKSYGLE